MAAALGSDYVAAPQRTRSPARHRTRNRRSSVAFPPQLELRNAPAGPIRVGMECAWSPFLSGHVRCARGGRPRRSV